MSCNTSLSALLLFLIWPLSARADDPREMFFESRIRPLLIDRCIECHGGDKPDAGLSLESRDGWIDRSVIQPGMPTNSSLIKAVRFADPKLQMPPPDSGYQKLTDAEVKLLEQWIADGAIDPRRATATTGPKRRAKEFQLTQQDLQHWAYQSLKLTPSFTEVDVAQPATSADSQPYYDAAQQIDLLIDRQLNIRNLKQNSAASPRELVRRAYFDLWGLPPRPEVVKQFEANPTEEAWLALINRLLESPNYGQRWGRYWLDWVRFAETNGYERDGIKPDAWRYRDYVISAFNNDKPYDRFLTEQLAGDLLIDAEQLSVGNQSKAWRDCIIATGFYRLHVWDDEPDSTDAAEMDDLDDIIVTTGTAMLGLTIGCARCHDHKFDPISQVDYYSLLDLFRDIDPYGQSKKGGGGRGTGRIDRYLVDPAIVENWQARHVESIQEVEKQLAEAEKIDKSDNAGESTKQILKDRLKKLREQSPPFEKALSVNAPPTGPKPTHVLIRGDHHSPATLVSPAVPALFRALSGNQPAKLEGQQSLSTGATRAPSDEPTQPETPTRSAAKSDSSNFRNRLDFAKWITSKSHPLTARVLVNRVWQKHFGTGIAPTTDDFGFTGVPPANLWLLDALADFLHRRQWSIKDLHRAIMLSKTYRLSSVGNIDHRDIDSDNIYYWRQNLRRLDAEAIRDSMLAYAGVLQDKSSGPSVYSNLSTEIRETANPVSLSTWGSSTEAEQNCRSVFLVVKRSLKDPILESFDFANSNSPVGQRAVTTVAPQALMMLNDGFMQKHCQELAERVLASRKETGDRIEQLWQIVLQRSPTTRESQSIREFLEAMQPDANLTELQQWTSLCRSLLNLNETIYID